MRSVAPYTSPSLEMIFCTLSPSATWRCSLCSESTSFRSAPEQSSNSTIRSASMTSLPLPPMMPVNFWADSRYRSRYSGSHCSRARRLEFLCNHYLLGEQCAFHTTLGRPQLLLRHFTVDQNLELLADSPYNHINMMYVAWESWLTFSIVLEDSPPAYARMFARTLRESLWKIHAIGLGWPPTRRHVRDILQDSGWY